MRILGIFEFTDISWKKDKYEVFWNQAFRAVWNLNFDPFDPIFDIHIHRFNKDKLKVSLYIKNEVQFLAFILENTENCWISWSAVDFLKLWIVIIWGVYSTRCDMNA